MTTYGVDRSGAAGGAASGVNPIDETVIDAKGDLLVGDAADSIDNLTVGANDTILMADSAEALGVKWAAPNVVLKAIINGATAETAPAVADTIGIYDDSGAVGRKMTLENALKVINLLTAGTEIDGANDKLLVYDNSASAVRAIPAGVPFRKNAIINGDFNVWQRGTNFVGPASATYAADRWRYNKSGAMVHNLSQQTEVPTVAEAGRKFNYSMAIGVSTIDSSIAAGDYTYFGQVIEGYNFLPLAQKSFTLSFWVRSFKTGTFCVAFINSGNDRSYVAEYTVSASNTWEKKTINVTASPSAGTWDYTNGQGILVAFTMAAGSTYHTTAGAWQTGIFLSTSNQVNNTDSTSNTLYITGVQVEAGDVVTDFEYRTYPDELALCMRYYEVMPLSGVLFTGQATATDQAMGCIRWMVPKRTAPATVGLPSAGSGAGSICFLNVNGNPPGTVGSHSITDLTTCGFRVTATGYTAAFTAGDASMFYYNGTTGSATINADF